MRKYLRNMALFSLGLLMGCCLFSTESNASTTYANADIHPFSGKIYLVGDSIMANYHQTIVTTLGRMGWGMCMKNYFDSSVKITNLARCGRSTRTYTALPDYTTLLSQVGAGDYVFISFGHNDEKTDVNQTITGLNQGTIDATGKDSKGRYSYEWFLINKYIQPILKRGATPVLITPVTRRSSSGKANFTKHTPYQKAMISVANTMKIPYIDLTPFTVSYVQSVYNSSKALGTAKLYARKYSGLRLVVDNTHLGPIFSEAVANMVAASLDRMHLLAADSLLQEKVGQNTINITDIKKVSLGGKTYYDGITRKRPVTLTLQRIDENGRSIIGQTITATATATLPTKGAGIYTMYSLSNVVLPEGSNYTVLPTDVFVMSEAAGLGNASSLIIRKVDKPFATPTTVFYVPSKTVRLKESLLKDYPGWSFGTMKNRYLYSGMKVRIEYLANDKKSFKKTSKTIKIVVNTRKYLARKRARK